LQNFLGMAGQFFQFSLGFVRMDKFDQLNLVKLMLTDQAAGVFAV
jgi:hypothetical protein